MSTRTVGAETSLDPQAVEALLAGSHGDPFAALGVQEAGGRLVARCVIPGADEVEAFTAAGEPAGTLARTHEAGFFEGPLTLRRRQPRSPSPMTTTWRRASRCTRDRRRWPRNTV